ENDVSGIDINMGCPKEFSIKGGMGAALLAQPEKIKKILTTLVENVSLPITCKIRVLPDLNDTINLVKLIESCGVRAIAIHGRTRMERPQHKNRNTYIAAIVKEVKVPIIAKFVKALFAFLSNLQLNFSGGSGEIQEYTDIDTFKNETNASSVMLSRAAEHNCSIFRKEGLLPLDTVICSYLQYAVKYDNHVSNTKYCIQQMLGSLQETEKGRAFLSAQHLKEIWYLRHCDSLQIINSCFLLSDLWEMTSFYEDSVNELKRRFTQENDEIENIHKKRRIKLNEDEICLSLKYIKNLFDECSLPKSRLINYTTKRCLPPPKYKTYQIEKHFYAVVTVENKCYKNSYLEKNKKSAEQGAALVACYNLNLVDESVISQCYVQEVPHERTLLTIAQS
ncbi:tRNA-dihydrouridine(20) synthase-like [NAD(P)+], partial [Dinothrombium tinctorium]